MAKFTSSDIGFSFQVNDDWTFISKESYQKLDISGDPLFFFVKTENEKIIQTLYFGSEEIINEKEIDNLINENKLTLVKAGFIVDVKKNIIEERKYYVFSLKDKGENRIIMFFTKIKNSLINFGTLSNTNIEITESELLDIMASITEI